MYGHIWIFIPVSRLGDFFFVWGQVLLGLIPVRADSFLGTQTVRADSIRADSLWAYSFFSTHTVRADSVRAGSVRADSCFTTQMVGQIPLGQNPLGQIPLGQVLLGLSTVGLFLLGQVTSPCFQECGMRAVACVRRLASVVAPYCVFSFLFSCGSISVH